MKLCSCTVILGELLGLSLILPTEFRFLVTNKSYFLRQQAWGELISCNVLYCAAVLHSDKAEDSPTLINPAILSLQKHCRILKSVRDKAIKFVDVAAFFFSFFFKIPCLVNLYFPWKSWYRDLNEYGTMAWQTPVPVVQLLAREQRAVKKL